MAYTSVKFNPEKEVFEISHRVFQDDFENTLKNNYRFAGGDVCTGQQNPMTQKAVNLFFEKNFLLFFDQVKQKMRYVRTEQKNQMGIIVYYETGKVNLTAIHRVEVHNSIMMESFKEQVNMFQFYVNEASKRTLKFELGSTKATFSL
jgi:hypothetical protein